jgi:predicted ATP-grasp superfamily ATP-dependent carboligase
MPSVLIAAASGRALAASARRAGYAPLVADFFGDLDTLAVARAYVRLPDGLARGMDETLLDALETLAAGEQPCGLVWGTGFEDRPHLLAQLARRWPLLGNTAESVAIVKDPIAFARLCEDCGISHPETSRSRPADVAGWLRKRIGGAGGSHIRSAAGHDDLNRDVYFQRCVDGVPVSVSFLADGHRALILGCSAQWSSPTLRQPFRYGGAARPADVSRDVERALARAVQDIAATVPLVGLNSADFLVHGNAFHLLEINPRPGATLDIFEPADGSLFALHVAACARQLPDRAPALDGAAASAIVYADRDIRAPALDWPAWTADRPQAGISVKAGEPFCTVHARGETAAEARRFVERRQAAILTLAEARAA